MQVNKLITRLQEVLTGKKKQGLKCKLLKKLRKEYRIVRVEQVDGRYATKEILQVKEKYGLPFYAVLSQGSGYALYYHRHLNHCKDYIVEVAYQEWGRRIKGASSTGINVWGN